MQEGDTLHGKPQADWENSSPRSPTTNVGSTTKHTTKNLQAKHKKPSRRDTNAMRHAQQSLLDKPQIELLGRASDTIPSDNRTSTSDDKIAQKIK
jgi:hypothetical protein